VKITSLNRQGERIGLQAEGFPARYIQHEIWSQVAKGDCPLMGQPLISRLLIRVVLLARQFLTGILAWVALRLALAVLPVFLLRIMQFFYELMGVVHRESNPFCN